MNSDQRALLELYDSMVMDRKEGRISAEDAIKTIQNVLIENTGSRTRNGLVYINNMDINIEDNDVIECNENTECNCDSNSSEVIINYHCDCNTATILVDSDYTITQNDYYIGVNSDGPVTISLPLNPENGFKCCIKAEMGPPLGNRKITIQADDGSLIDGQSKIVFTQPYEYTCLIYRGENWFII